MALNKPTITMVANQTLLVSFTTDIAWNPYSKGSFQVVWANISAATNSTIKLTAYNIGASAFPVNLSSSPSAFTLLTEGQSGSYFFNIDPVHADFIRFHYIAGTNGAGSMNVYVRKDGYGA